VPSAFTESGAEVLFFFYIRSVFSPLTPKVEMKIRSGAGEESDPFDQVGETSASPLHFMLCLFLVGHSGKPACVILFK